ncbi:putative DNA-binding domain-containing protein [Paraglaciecola sp. 2405UD69-4]|uniref:HvfC/BufC family peptide modification chaperone n=1 Tax=Paraglaciecola sp. 2405UD69-4 TaxID=3391836 RepID=UPI0039C8DC73
MSEFHAAFIDYVKTGSLEAISSHLSGTESQGRLAVYRNTFISGCIDGLVRKYPSCEKLLGVDFFKSLARDYAINYPPSSPVISEFGENYPEYIRDTLKQNYPQLSYVWDICQLDRAWHHAYFAPEKTPLDEAGIESLITNIENQSLSLHPSVQLVQTKSAISDLWSQLRDGDINEKTPLSLTPETIMLWRDEDKILHRTLCTPEAIFIQSIQEGKTLGESAEIAIQSEELDISNTFSQLLLNNLIT